MQTKLSGKPDSYTYHKRLSSSEAWQEISEQEYNELCPEKPIGEVAKPNTEAWRRGLKSLGLAFNHKQLPAMQEEAKRLGIAVEFDTSDHRLVTPVFHSREARKQYLVAHGRCDQDGGYSDG